VEEEDAEPEFCDRFLLFEEEEEDDDDDG